MQYPRKPAPPMLKAKQQLDSTRIADIEATVREKLNAAGLKERVRPGARIAITAGSRDMGGFVRLLRGTVQALRLAGAEPFIIPAMGSHGGATAEGQAQLLRRLGVNPAELGAEIRATMNTADLGASASGAHAHLDEIVRDSDGVIVLGRIKTHPENTEEIASGLLKMVTVGLGKQTGAQEAHSHGLWESVKAVPELTMATGKVLFGIGVVENGFREPVEIEAVPGKYTAFFDTDKRLLNVAKKHFARIPFEHLDVLIVDQLGKTISGTGMDLNVIGPWRLKGGDKRPDYQRIVALSLTEGSMGNGLGIGLADFTTRRFVDQFDPHATWINLLTATEPGAENTVEGRLPLALQSDREAVEVALYSSLAKSPRVCRIESTARLDELWISESLVDEAKANGLDLLSTPGPLPFDTNGNLFQ